GSAARSANADQNKDKENDSRHPHNCGLSILAIRRSRHWYQSRFSSQVNFSVFFNSYRKHSQAKPFKPCATLSKPRSGLRQSPRDFHINYSRSLPNVSAADRD